MFDDDEISLSFQMELQSLQVRTAAGVSRIQRAHLPEGVRAVLRWLSQGVMAARAGRWDEVQQAIDEAEKHDAELVPYLDSSSYEAFQIAVASLKSRLETRKREQ